MTLSIAKGLEFRAVVVMAFDDEVLPDQERTEAIIDEPTWRKCTIPSATFSTLPAHGPETDCW